MKLKGIALLKYGIAALVLALFIVGLISLNKSAKGEVPTAASQLVFVRAHVVELYSDNAEPDTWTEGRRLGTQELYAQLDSGEFKGTTLPAVNYMNAYSNIDLKVGTHIIVRLDTDEQGNPYIASIANYNRSLAIIGLMLIFAVLLVVLGGKKGITALLGLGFTVISIWFFLIPLIQRGFPPIPATLCLVAVTTAVSLLLLNGFTYKTLCAAAGCIGGVAIAGLAAGLFGLITPINGFNMTEAEELVLRAGDSIIKISGLLASGILISALGAVMDIAMTITSAVFEINEINPKTDRNKLFKSGINIGRDAMGTMANTLILAFAGASLNMLILFRVFDYPYLQIFNSDLMTIEIIQGLAGSIGIVMTVPIVAALGAAMCKRYKGPGK